MVRRNPPVEVMLVDCAIACGRGAGNKKVSLAASAFWALNYKQAIINAIPNGLVWSRDRRKILLAGVRLGQIAKSLAAGKKQISKGHARKASKLVTDDPVCPPGSGRICPPGGF